MKYRNVLRIAQWLLMAAAYGWLLWKLLTYDDWEGFCERFAMAGGRQYGALFIVLLLCGANVTAEALKWRVLLRGVVQLSFIEAFQQTLYGNVGGFFTPSRIGDYPMRALLLRNKDQWLAAVSLGFVGSAALTLVLLLAGFPSAVILLERQGGFRMAETICAGVFILLAASVAVYRPLAIWLLHRKIHYPEKIRNVLAALSVFPYSRFMLVILFSALRYAVWCIQLWLLLYFCGIRLPLVDALTAIPAYYMLVTVTPSIPAADAAVRGSWAVVVFGVLTHDIAAVAVAAVLMWLINGVLPMIAGSMMKERV